MDLPLTFGNNCLFAVAVTVSIAFGTYLLNIPRLIRKGRLLYQLSNGVEAALSSSNEEPSLVMSNRIAKITYTYLGRKYTMALPYNRDNVAAMGSLTAHLVHLDGKVEEITHQPGFPYLVSAAAYDAKEIVLTNTEEAIQYAYVDNAVPNWCQEVFE